MLIVKKNNFDRWELLLKVLSAEIPEDDDSFQSWLHERVENQKLYNELKGQVKAEEFDKDAVFSRISNRLSFRKESRIPIYRRFWFGYVAGLLFIMSLCVGLFYHKSNTSKEIDILPDDVSVFDPGGKKAYLLTPGRESIDLTDAFEIVKDDGTVISNGDEGIVSFENTQQLNNKVEYHTIYVPKGGEYELSLADGSKVFLNSETRLEFPSFFSGETREVKLTGEAYFEVRKDTKPFIVQTEELRIKVLGTSFNVHAYDNESFSNTTLVNGSVQIHTLKDEKTYQLKPQQHFDMDKHSDEVSIYQVDTELYTAWVRGEFIFRNQPLKHIFSQLERWYDFTIVYDDPSIQQMRFTGSAEKTRSLTYLLGLIESVTDLEYKDIEDKIVLYK